MFYLTFALLLITVVFNKKFSKRVKLFLLILPMILITFFRFGFGADYFAYKHMYQRILIDSFGSLFRYYPEIEIGFKFLMWPFRLLHIPFHVFFIIINLIVLGLTLKWIEENSTAFETSILLFYSMFFFVWVLSAARQGLVMSFALYFLFNENRKQNLIFKILLIFALSLIHKSALILFVFLVFDRLKWTRKKHLFFLLLSIGVTFLPLSKIMEPFIGIGIVHKIITKYLSSSVKVYDFPGLVRFIFYIFVLLFYNLFQEKNKIYADRFLYGISTYYVFKFSEITASRLTIFTFIGIILLIPIVVEYMKEEWNNKYFFTGLLFLFSVFYFNKELNTMVYQSAYLNETKWIPMETIFEANTSKFYKRESFVLDVELIAKEKKLQYEQKNKLKTKFNNDLNYLVVKKAHKDYRIIDENGEYLEDYKFSREVVLKDGILIEPRFYKHHFFDNPVLIDLSDRERSKKEKMKVIDDALIEEAHHYLKETKISVTKDDIPKSVLKYYSNKDKIMNVWMTEINEPFNYYVMRIDYIDQKTYLYLNEDMQPMIDLIFTDVSPFSNTNTSRVGVYSSNFLINNKGEVIWWYDS